LRLPHTLARINRLFQEKLKETQMQETVFTKLLLLTKKQSLGIKQRLKKTHFNDEIKARVEGLIRQDYSSEQIEGRCKMKGIPIVSKETIYQYIWEDKRQGGFLYTPSNQRKKV